LTTNLRKIEKLFPSVYITLISILLGFAIEDVITRLRELAPLDPHTLLTAAALLSIIFSAWTGYSFISMTQQRLPRLLDSINVFLLALAIYMMNSTLGLEIWIFFCAAAIYLAIAIFSTIYNYQIFLENLSASYSWRIFSINVWISVLSVVICANAAWMSKQGLLPYILELCLIASLIIIASLWTYFFYKTWTKVVQEFG
jgi:hypothetical protein